MQVELDLHSLVANLAALKRQREAALRRAAAAQAEAEALDSIIAGIEKLSNGNVQLPLAGTTGVIANDALGGVAVSDRGIRGAEAIRRVMADGRPRRQQEIIAEVKSRGWIKSNAKNPDAAIRESVRRMAALGELERVPGAHATFRRSPPKRTVPPHFEEVDPRAE